jgi:hypothetical protein
MLASLPRSIDPAIPSTCADLAKTHRKTVRICSIIPETRLQRAAREPAVLGDASEFGSFFTPRLRMIREARSLVGGARTKPQFSPFAFS